MASYTSPVGILRTSKASDQDVVSRMSMSDSASRISSLETEISTMNRVFQGAVDQLRLQAEAHASAQLAQASMISEILDMLKKQKLGSTPPSVTTPNQSEVANHPQTEDASGSDGVAGHG